VRRAGFDPPDKRSVAAAVRIPAPAAAKAITPFDEVIASVGDTISTTTLTGWLTKLVAYPTRHSLSSHNLAAGEWLKLQLASLGWSASFHDFAISGLNRRNVIATRIGSTTPSEHLVVCAHYDSRMSVLSDSTSPAPGANDNGSGTVALLALAKALAQIPTKRSIRLIAFSGEEQGLVGSDAYASLAASSGIAIDMLINLDMIGHPTTANTLIVERDTGNVTTTNDAASQAFANALVQAASDFAGLSTVLGPIYSSDYMPFEKKGYVCVGGFDGADTTSFYHSSTDTIDKVDISFLRNVIRAVLGAIGRREVMTVGAALIHDPDPITRSGNLGLTPASPGLDALRSATWLKDLAAPDVAGYHLSGIDVVLIAGETPTIAPPARLDGVFSFSRTDAAFEATMAYAYAGRVRDIVTGLGLTSVGPMPLQIDAHASLTRYISASSTLYLGDGSGGVDDGEDGGVICYGMAQAILATQLPGFASSDGVGSGFGGSLSAILNDEKHVLPVSRGLTAPWAWPTRRHDRDWLFDDPSITTDIAKGQLWAATTFEIFRKLGGDSQWYPAVRSAARDLMIRLHLMANAAVPASPTTTQMAQQIEAADDNLGGWRYADGLHGKVIYDTFRRRHLTGYPDLAVDVYVDDGRAGGYGSPSGSDLFSENLWDDNYWDTQDIWVRTSPYASPAAQAAGGPADHVEPPTGSPAYLYVRVRNRGTGAAGSGPVTVKAFHCEPGLGLVWPDAWSPMDTPSLAVANILPGPANGVVVGPFDWTPTEVGHECVLVIVESANDPAVTQNLAASAHVNHSDLVPFDNNIAQRNLVPTAPKGTTKRGFWITNPELEPRTVELRVEDNLPDGWRWRLNLADPAAVRLGGLERRWVELTIDQAEGAAVTDFRVPARVTLAGSIEGRGIGGMTFYVAPPEATRPSRPGRAGEVELTNPLLCLNLPWEDLEVEGELELRMRFRSRP